MTAIATTEHGLPRSNVSKWLYCKEKGIKLLFGVEIYLTENLEPKVRDNYHTVLIARNKDGLKELHNLIELSTRDDHFYYANRISFDDFLGISDNIIKTSACLASPLNKLTDDHPRYMELAQHYDYLEVQPHHHEEQIAFNQRLLKLSRELGKPLIVGTDTHNSTPYKAECRRMLMIRKKKSYGDEDQFDLTWKTYDELIEMFALQGALPEDVVLEALENTNRLATSCESIDFDQSIKYPILYGSREEDSRRFVDLIERKFAEKIERGIIPQYQVAAFREAIDEEVRVFQKLQMDGFMLSMAELLMWCKEQGMAIGTARGSVGGSRVAYVTDVVDLNPETWKTVFSRFCNEDREEIGDIDIDCVDTDRPAIFRHIEERFGAEHTARVGSYGTIADAGVIDDVGGALRILWEKDHPQEEKSQCPWALKKIDKIKEEYNSDKDAARNKYPQLFYYFDGLLGTRVSQSVHPAGMVISPLNLCEEYGVFHKDGERCLCLDMEELHEVGAAKYDFLILKTVTVIRDTCRMLGQAYPRTHEINWDDPCVWEDMLRSPCGVFQMESPYAFECLKKMRPQNIFDMSLVTACIRPSGASYRDALLARKPHSNPSPIIDDLLRENLGYLIYQEDTIKFLQQVCGLSGSQADNIRRAIGRKQKDRLDAALPSILEGYCNKSDKPRADAEQEAKEFLQVIEDSASYQFGYNHSIAYCMLGYLCAYYRYYHPAEFITAFLNNAANNEDIASGAKLAKCYGIQVVPPRFGISGSDYTCSRDARQIAKGLSSLNGIGKSVSQRIQEASMLNYTYFVDVLDCLMHRYGVHSNQIQTLIHIDFFTDYGNQRELDRIFDLFDFFKQGEAKQIKKERVVGSLFEELIKANATGTTKSGKEAASYTITDMHAILTGCEQIILSSGLEDYSVVTKVKHFADAMGYSGYVSGRDEDRRKLYIREIYPLKRKKDGKQFGYSILTQSIGSGIESRFTVFNRVYDLEPVKKGDVISCTGYTKDGPYFTMTGYRKIYEFDVEEAS